MYQLQQGGGLRPFCEASDARVRSSEADERDEEGDAPEDDEPEERGDEVVEDQVLGLGRAGLKGFGVWFSHGCFGVLGVHCEIRGIW